MAGAEAVWIFLMGWLVATPVHTATVDTRAKARNASMGIAIAIFVVFAFHGWLIFGSGTSASFSADVRIDIEKDGQTVEYAGKLQMRVGKVSTLRLDGHIVDMIIQDASADEASVELRVFEDVNGRRGRNLASCVDFAAPIGQVFGVGVSCGDILIGLSGEIEPVD
ncbi:MAG: hypothetical protein AAFY56_07350 [Pseudomonadota bacterium]